ncbi:cytochrome P450 [Lasiosphaeria hispida]|uniref:Cytochrome P450 n=1 Tax=Lasiosphaeria hispida TaxID=260671 RepID=A0AAJ0MKC4_9PEZI|nr:cytochrome P450 [Lasiosphaeria hispida]
MMTLILGILGVPLTIWSLHHTYRAVFHTPGATFASYVFALALSYITIKLNVSFIQHLQFERRARALGCGTVAVFPHKDPVLGLDSFFEALRSMKAKKLMNFYLDRFARYGNTHYNITLGRWILMTNESENLKAILGTQIEDWPIDGPRLYAALPVLGPHSVFSSNGKAWQDARAMIRPSFVRDQVADLESFDRHIKNMLAAVPRDGSTFDLQKLLLCMTMDSSTDFLLGHSSNTLIKASPEAQQFLQDFDYAGQEAAIKARLGPMLFYLPQPKLTRSVKRLREYIRFYLKKTAADKAEKGESKDRSYVFLDELLKANAPEEYVVDQILSIMIAGRDTTAASLSAVFYFLARNSAAVEKLRSEIHDVGEENPSWEQLRQMKYLNNVVREALRLFPPVAVNSRTANKDTILPRGGGPDGGQPVLVPKGISARWSLYSLHRRKDIYGPDADEFRPERWEDLRVGWEYIPFHGGPRICIGQQFALTQMSYTLYKFFSVFQTIEARENGDLLVQASLTNTFAKGVLVSVAPVKES